MPLFLNRREENIFFPFRAFRPAGLSGGKVLSLLSESGGTFWQKWRRFESEMPALFAGGMLRFGGNGYLCLREDRSRLGIVRAKTSLSLASALAFRYLCPAFQPPFRRRNGGGRVKNRAPDTMKERIFFLLKLYVAFLVVQVLQKPLFMFYAADAPFRYSVRDYLATMLHGLWLDAAVSGYLTAFPLLLLLVSLWWPRGFPLRAVLRPYIYLVVAVLELAFVVDAAIYPFWNYKLDATLLYYIDSPAEALASVSPLFVAIGLLLWAVLSAGVGYCLVRLVPKRLPDARKWGTSWRLCPVFAGFCCVAGLLFLAIRGGVGESTSNVGKVYYSSDLFLNHSAVNPTFSFLASLGKGEDFAARFDYFPEAERAALVEGLYPSVESDSLTVSLLRTPRPNVLLILMEGFGATFVEGLGGVPDVAPNLEKLSHEGVWFTNCYANSFRTDRGMVCALGGYLGLPDVSVMKVPAKSRTLPCLAGRLAEAGYATDFLYGGDINFTNMQGYLRTGGYQSITADADFPYAEQRASKWGVPDHYTFARLYEMMKARSENPPARPWHTAFLTLSSHEPFEVPYSRLAEKIPNAFAYTDSCLGDFIGRLKKLPVWKDLLVICVPDHGYYYPREGLSQSPRFFHIPMLWLGGALKESRVVSDLMNQSDLPATLLAQMGLPYADFPFSRNVFGTDYRYPFAYYAFNNGMAFCDSTGCTVFDNASLQVIYDRPAAQTADSAAAAGSRLRRAKAILQTSYDDLGRR